MNVAFLIFNRPELTSRVFAEIARAKPKMLLIVADGPRNEQERVQCMATRAIAERVDWDCTVLKNYSEVNLGCRRRIASGLEWIFSQVEEAIIVEDDCLPNSDFFRFCAEMLDYYRDDERVGHICGLNVSERLPRDGSSYGFSLYPSIWGWATWRRAWVAYDVDIKAWPEFRDNRLHDGIFPTHHEALVFEKALNDIVAGRSDTWDGQWFFSRLCQGTLAIRPAVNLITNIGFGAKGSTHTDFDHPVGHLETRPLSFPLKHPIWFIVDRPSDERLVEMCFQLGPSRWERMTAFVLNRHWYGSMLRAMPLVGRCWSKWRSYRTKVGATSTRVRNWKAS
jgi:hypothetical protein